MANANVVELTDANWEKEVVQSDKPVLVDFWAVWCGPCRALGPTIDKLAEKYAGKVKVGKLNVDESQDTAATYRVSSIPLVMLFNGGAQPVDQTVGLNREDAYDKMITPRSEVRGQESGVRNQGPGRPSVTPRSLLVPKLCLGTPSAKLRFASGSGTGRETEFRRRACPNRVWARGARTRLLTRDS